MFETYGILALILLGAGLSLLIAEVFLPSGGILAILTTVSLCLSLVFAYAAWFQRYPLLWWVFLGMVLFSIPTTLGLALYLLPKTSLGRRILLDAPDPSEVEPLARDSARLEKLVGKLGTAATILAPGGLIVIENERVHAFTEGQIVEAGSTVQVLEVRGTRLLVRPAAPGAEPPAPAQPAAPTSRSADSPFDFEIPAE